MVKPALHRGLALGILFATACNGQTESQVKNYFAHNNLNYPIEIETTDKNQIEYMPDPALDHPVQRTKKDDQEFYHNAIDHFNKTNRLHFSSIFNKNNGYVIKQPKIYYDLENHRYIALPVTEYSSICDNGRSIRVDQNICYQSNIALFKNIANGQWEFQGWVL